MNVQMSEVNNQVSDQIIPKEIKPEIIEKPDSIANLKNTSVRASQDTKKNEVEKENPENIVELTNRNQITIEKTNQTLNSNKIAQDINQQVNKVDINPKKLQTAGKKSQTSKYKLMKTMVWCSKNMHGCTARKKHQ